MKTKTLPRRDRRLFPASLAGALALLLAAGMAQAANPIVRSHVKTLSNNSIEIKSDGKTYGGLASVGDASLTVRGEVMINTNSTFKYVKSYSTWPFLHEANGGAGLIEFTQKKVSKEFTRADLGTDVRPTIIYPQHNQFQISLGPDLLLPYLAGRCNALAQKLRANGMSDLAIFQQDRTIPIAIDSNMHWAITGEEGYTGVNARPADAGPRPTFNLVCKEHQAPVPPGTTAGGTPPAGVGPALLTQVSLAIPHSTVPQSCPVELQAQITLRAAAFDETGQPRAPGRASYRVRSVSNLASPEAHVHFNAQDKQGSHFVRVITHKFTVGKAPASTTPVLGTPARGAATGLAPGIGAGPGLGGAMGESAGSSGGGIGGSAVGGAYAQQAGDPNTYQDSLWVDITAAKNGSVMASQHVFYRINCKQVAFDKPSSVAAPQAPQKPTHGGTPTGQPGTPVPGTNQPGTGPSTGMPPPGQPGAPTPGANPPGTGPSTGLPPPVQPPAAVAGQKAVAAQSPTPQAPASRPSLVAPNRLGVAR